MSNPDPKAEVGKNLQMAHKFSGIRFKDLMEKTGLTRTALANYEAGERLPGSQVILAYSNLTGVSVAALMDENHPIWTAIKSHLDYQEWLRQQRDRAYRIHAALEKLTDNLYPLDEEGADE